MYTVPGIGLESTNTKDSASPQGLMIDGKDTTVTQSNSAGEERSGRLYGSTAATSERLHSANALLIFSEIADTQETTDTLQHQSFQGINIL